MKKNIFIFGLLLVISWLTISVIKLESYHYASQIGLCSEFEFPEQSIERDQCLNETETRTNPMFHLFYGLSIL